jgi:hypothetical protein
MVATAKIVASTGLMYAFVPGNLNRGLAGLRELGLEAGPRTNLWANVTNGVIAHDMRESMATYATHAVRVADDEVAGSRRRGVGFIAILAVVLALTAVVSGAATLWVNYTTAYTYDQAAVSPIDTFGTLNMGRYFVMSPAVSYERELLEGHNVLGNMGAGGLLVFVCGYLSLRLSWWPLGPLGPLLAYTWVVRRFWVSIFVGWAAKVVLLRLTGARGIAAARPVLLGIIIGEAFTSFFWIVISLSRLQLGLDYFPYEVLPG